MGQCTETEEAPSGHRGATPVTDLKQLFDIDAVTPAPLQNSLF